MRVLAALALVVLLTPAGADDWPRFRGPDGDGRSAETGLLARWPAEGPKRLWSAGGLGVGWSSASVAGGRIYVSAMERGDGFLHCLDTNGARLWKVGYGKEWDGLGRWVYPGAHSTPTVDGDRVYLMTGHGVVACHDARSGARIWAVDTVATFGGRNIQWGFAESLVVDGDAVYATPGGEHAAVVKLDKRTGKTLWACDHDQTSAYCSPALLTVGGQRLLVTMLEGGMVGIDPATGKLLWDEQFSNEPLIHANTPVLSASGLLFCAIGYGEGSLAVRLSDGGRSVRAAWDAARMDIQHGGAVIIGDHVYGTSMRRPKARLMCLDARTGAVAAESRVVGEASVVTAEGLLYVYGTSGLLALVAASPTALETRGQLRVTDGRGEHWAHPSIARGVLYLRHGDALTAYDIRRR